jgi:glycosyltransferase involved in cell wall biosynthesis
VRTAQRARLELAPEQPLLTFVGNLEYEPNQMAVRRIAQDIGPAIVSAYPEARFMVIGQGAERVSEHQRPWLSFSGYLSRSELVAHLCATDLFLVPIELGAGIRVKITEAAACGRAVISTRRAAVGLEQFEDGELVRVDDAGASFVEATLALIQDPGRREAVGELARKRTRATFGWERALGAYEDVYRSIGALA